MSRSARRRRNDHHPAPSPGALRIIAGEFGGRRVDAPGGTESRPTADRVREAIFNMLESRRGIDGAMVLDAFAGSGAFGLEALSRGAENVRFADTSAAAVSVIRDNLDELGLAHRAEVRNIDALMALGTGRWDIIFLDPPYGHDEAAWAELLRGVIDTLAPGGVVVTESDHEISAPEGMDALRSRRYGGTVVTFLIHTGVDE